MNIKDKPKELSHGSFFLLNIIEDVGKEELISFKNNIPLLLELESNGYIRVLEDKILVLKSFNSQSKDVKEILDYLNKLSGKKFRLVESNKSLIRARLNEGASKEDIMKVISFKVNEWKGTKMSGYIRPETLFNATKFNSYLPEAESIDLNNSRIMTG